MHVKEINFNNMLKFHQILSSGITIIMGQKSAKIRILFFAYLHELKIPYVHIILKKMYNSDFGGFSIHDNGHTTGQNLFMNRRIRFFISFIFFTLIEIIELSSKYSA